MISIFQMTISENHAGSQKGYDHIKKIMGHVRKLLEAETEKVPAKVTHFLVCPEGKIQHKWKMPKGWKNSIGKDVFCVRVPASAHRGMLCLFTPDSAT